MKKLVFIFLIFLLFISIVNAKSVLIDSYENEGNYYSIYVQHPSTTALYSILGQRFIQRVNMTCNITNISLKIQRIGSPNSQVQVWIWNTSLVTGLPNIKISESEIYNTIDFSTSVTIFNFTFTGNNQIELETGKDYIFGLVWIGISGTSSNRLVIFNDSTFTYGSGDLIYYSSSIFTMLPLRDSFFYVYGEQIEISGEYTESDLETYFISGLIIMAMVCALIITIYYKKGRS